MKKLDTGKIKVLFSYVLLSVFLLIFIFYFIREKDKFIRILSVSAWTILILVALDVIFITVNAYSIKRLKRAFSGQACDVVPLDGDLNDAFIFYIGQKFTVRGLLAYPIRRFEYIKHYDHH